MYDFYERVEIMKSFFKAIYVCRLSMNTIEVSLFHLYVCRNVVFTWDTSGF